MTNLGSPEIRFCPQLRDKIFAHLPPQAKSALLGVEVKFWPNNHGEMELKLKYDPTDNLLDIDATEGVYGPDGKLSGSIVKGCELHSETAEVHAYVEQMVASGGDQPLDAPLEDVMTDMTRFDTGKLNFLLNLFDSL